MSEWQDETGVQMRLVRRVVDSGGRAIHHKYDLLVPEWEAKSPVIRALGVRVNDARTVTKCHLPRELSAVYDPDDELPVTVRTRLVYSILVVTNQPGDLSAARDLYRKQSRKVDALPVIRDALRPAPAAAIRARWRWDTDSRWDAVAQEIARKNGLEGLAKLAESYFAPLFAPITESERLEFNDWCEADW